MVFIYALYFGDPKANSYKLSYKFEQTKMPDIEEIKETARSEGYDRAKKDCQIWYYCAVCRERIDMEPNSDSHKAMIGYMEEHGWREARKLSTTVAQKSNSYDSSSFSWQRKRLVSRVVA